MRNQSGKNHNARSPSSLFTQFYTRRDKLIRKILQNLPWVRVPALSPLLPPRHCRGARGIADQQLGHHVRGFLQGDHVGACAPSDDTRRGTSAFAPPPPCSLPPHIGSTQRPPSPLTSCRLTTILPSSNSAPACTWPSSSRVLSSARRYVARHRRAPEPSENLRRRAIDPFGRANPGF